MTQKRCSLTFNKPRAILGHILQNYVPPPISEKAIQWRRLFVFRDSIASLNNATISALKKFDVITTSIF